MTDWPVLRLEEDNDRLRARVARLTAALAVVWREFPETYAESIPADVADLAEAALDATRRDPDSVSTIPTTLKELS
jgi:hypothetical protein